MFTHYLLGGSLLTQQPQSQRVLLMLLERRLLEAHLVML